MLVALPSSFSQPSTDCRQPSSRYFYSERGSRRIENNAGLAGWEVILSSLSLQARFLHLVNFRRAQRSPVECQCMRHGHGGVAARIRARPTPEPIRRSKSIPRNDDAAASRSSAVRCKHRSVECTCTCCSYVCRTHWFRARSDSLFTRRPIFERRLLTRDFPLVGKIKARAARWRG